MMNSRERVINILARKTADLVPVDIWHTPEVETALINYCCNIQAATPVENILAMIDTVNNW